MAKKANEEKKDTKVVKLEVDELQKKLKQSIEKAQALNTKIENLETFLEKHGVLIKWQNTIKQDDDKTNLDSDVLRLKLIGGQYRDEAVISINNKVILDEFLTFAINKISVKIDELEKDIANAS